MSTPININGLPTLAQTISAQARHKPDNIAFSEAGREMTWAQYDKQATVLASALISTGIPRNAIMAILLPDGMDVHIIASACERAGVVIMAIPARAGEKEILHLMQVSKATALFSYPEHRNLKTQQLFQKAQQHNEILQFHITYTGYLSDLDALTVNGDRYPFNIEQATSTVIDTRYFDADELFLLNSTSGTTGMPKCVTHNQSRWFYFSEKVQQGSELYEDDVFLSVAPAMVGFGIWTQHFVPALLGAKLILMPAFDAEETLRLIDQHKVTMLSAVTTQFVMMLNHPNFTQYDLGSLRILYTGGEVVPYQRAEEFEKKTNACVLQVYGSNENGMLSQTTMHDRREKRLTTCGRINPEMNVRLIDEHGNDITSSGRGQPICKGPSMGFGYYNNEEGNRKLFTDDGSMKTGDIVTIDDEGYLKVVGRVDDFIIRGGKNISAKAVEDAVIAHPQVKIAAAIAMPDPVFGERICVYATLEQGASLTLNNLNALLLHNGTSKEYLPECLVLLDEMPISSGSKVAKHLLRENIQQRVQTGDLPDH